MVHLQEETDLDILEVLLKRFRDDIVKVVELSQRQSGHNRFHLITGGPRGECRVRLACRRRSKLSPQEAATTNVDMSNYGKKLHRGQPGRNNKRRLKMNI